MELIYSQLIIGTGKDSRLYIPGRPIPGIYKGALSLCFSNCWRSIHIWFWTTKFCKETRKFRRGLLHLFWILWKFENLIEDNDFPLYITNDLLTLPLWIGLMKPSIEMRYIINYTLVLSIKYAILKWFTAFMRAKISNLSILMRGCCRSVFSCYFATCHLVLETINIIFFECFIVACLLVVFLIY